MNDASDSTADARLSVAFDALQANRLDRAESILRPFLDERPDHPGALWMMARVAAGAGMDSEAELLLRRAVGIAPGFSEARFDLAQALHRLDRPLEVIEQVEQLVVEKPDNISLRNLLAMMLERVGRYEDSTAQHEWLKERQPDQPRIWVNYGHLLRTVGRTEQSIGAYRRALTLSPHMGDAWWSLANLKTGVLNRDDEAAIARSLERPGISQSDQVALLFALGRALEDRGEAEASFANYEEGNRLRREMLDYDPGEISRHVDRAEQLFTPAFFEARSGYGVAAADPIFIVGMPRAGSTLVDQILSSHPLVEGTAELPFLLDIARRLRFEAEDSGGTYPDVLADLDAAACAALGAEYLDRARERRRTDRPYFIDKMPNNWAHVGLIQLILPNARVIDVRRNPIACCLSNFRQHFAEGQEFSYGLDDLGRYYADYVRMMRHFDMVLPGRINRLLYEDLVVDTETVTRRLAGDLGLDFDPAMLRFHENKRAVYTSSSEQVRRPMNQAGLESWRPYEPWLGPLREALGPVLDDWGSAPGV